jgi:hypothetical protein
MDAGFERVDRDIRELGGIIFHFGGNWSAARAKEGLEPIARSK